MLASVGADDDAVTSRGRDAQGSRLIRYRSRVALRSPPTPRTRRRSKPRVSWASSVRRSTGSTTFTTTAFGAQLAGSSAQISRPSGRCPGRGRPGARPGLRTRPAARTTTSLPAIASMRSDPRIVRVVAAERAGLHQVEGLAGRDALLDIHQGHRGGPVLGNEERRVRPDIPPPIMLTCFMGTPSQTGRCRLARGSGPESADGGEIVAAGGGLRPPTAREGVHLRFCSP